MRPNRAFAFLVLALLASYGVEVRAGQDRPEVSKAVEQGLTEARELLDAGNNDAALSSADRALASAIQFDDVPGEAEAFGLRAQALAALKAYS